MIKFWLGCLFSAMTGAAVAVWWLTTDVNSGLTAQERQQLSPVLRVAPHVARYFDHQGLTPDEAINVAVYEAVNRSVVNINAKGSRSGLILEIHSEGAGSGAVLDTQGHIVTNNHVVQGARTIQATLFNGKDYEASVVGADPLNDLAVIRIDAPPRRVVSGNVRRLTTTQSRDARICLGQSFRPGAHFDHGNHLQLESLVANSWQLDDQIDHSDRCSD
ncbi:MAG: hypothetical protein KatS3mg113_0932 [Planctomycetaceae bacterium]|nr:MAG: hypothetical protein KatS3mg113_0932 [Planctomycetaceae bacterium]